MNSLMSLINEELMRQQSTINLIASENYASQAVLAATGSVLTNKYAEGYPHKRYYAGCSVIDMIEERAIELCRQLFGAEHCNVQPHAGSQANMAVYFSVLKPGDTILGMSLAAGGHLTHGHSVNFSGRLFNVVSYGVSPENDLLDYNEIEVLTHQHKPRMIVAGASAYSRTIDFAKISDIAHRNGALFFADMAHIAGLVATGLHPSPVPVADFVSSTTHKTLRGPRGGLILCKGDFAQKVDKAVMPGMQGGPLMNVIAAKAVAFEEALTEEFKTYQAQIIKNAQAMCTTFKELGYNIVTGGTDNHLFLINLKKSIPRGIPSTQGLNGFIVEQLLEQCNITVNRNAVPFDTESPLKTSGIRIGTPAVTTRGLKEDDCKEVALLIHEVITAKDDPSTLKKVAEQVKIICKRHPLSYKRLPF